MLFYLLLKYFLSPSISFIAWHVRRKQLSSFNLWVNNSWILKYLFRSEAFAAYTKKYHDNSSILFHISLFQVARNLILNKFCAQVTNSVNPFIVVTPEISRLRITTLSMIPPVSTFWFNGNLEAKASQASRQKMIFLTKLPAAGLLFQMTNLKNLTHEQNVNKKITPTNTTPLISTISLSSQNPLYFINIKHCLNT